MIQYETANARHCLRPVGGHFVGSVANQPRSQLRTKKAGIQMGVASFMPTARNKRPASS